MKLLQSSPQVVVCIVKNNAENRPGGYLNEGFELIGISAQP